MNLDVILAFVIIAFPLLTIIGVLTHGETQHSLAFIFASAFSISGTCIVAAPFQIITFFKTEESLPPSAQTAIRVCFLISGICVSHMCRLLYLFLRPRFPFALIPKNYENVEFTAAGFGFQISTLILSTVPGWTDGDPEISGLTHVRFALRCTALLYLAPISMLCSSKSMHHSLSRTYRLMCLSLPVTAHMLIVLSVFLNKLGWFGAVCDWVILLSAISVCLALLIHFKLLRKDHDIHPHALLMRMSD